MTADVVVVGGGPAGTTAAAFASRAGLRTVLVDKAIFPRDKSCGDAVCGESVEILRELGLEPLPLRQGFHRIRGEAFFNVRGDALRLPMGRDAGPPTGRVTPYVIARELFDDMLFQHVKGLPSVSTLEGFTFTDLLRDGARVTGVVGTDSDGRQRKIPARIVMGADGALSRVAQVVGAYDFRERKQEHWVAAFRTYYSGVTDLADNLEIHFLDTLMPGYLWIFPAANGMANVGAGMIESHVAPRNGTSRRNFKRLAYDAIASHPRLRPRFANATEVEGSFRGWQIPCGSERRKLAGDGWMLLGDAASLVDPLTGEGIANAMQSGKLAALYAARALARGAHLSTELDAYGAEVWQVLGPGLETSYRLQRLVAHPFTGRLVESLITQAARHPRVRDAIVRIVRRLF
jgi:geranylgeranyl reductase family protein